MSIQRVPSVPFAQIANSALRDTRLSFKARGLLALVLSNVGEWEASRDWLMNQSDKDGQIAVQSALNELTECGYRRVVKERQPDGTFATIVLWFQVPECEDNRPVGNLPDGLSVGEETNRSIEHHPLEDYLEENQEEPFTSATPPREDVQALCQLLIDELRRNGSTRDYTITKAWRDAARLMLDRDKIPYEDVRGAILWSQSHEFWRGVILSMPKLREKYDQLRLQAQRKNTTESKRDGHIALIQELWDNENGSQTLQLEG